MRGEDKLWRSWGYDGCERIPEGCVRFILEPITVAPQEVSKSCERLTHNVNYIISLSRLRNK